MNKLTDEGKLRINGKIYETQKILKVYNTTFQEYMKDSGRRNDILLGETVSTKIGKGVIVGWNRSSNYDMYSFENQAVVNIHPNDVEKIEDNSTFIVQ